LGRDVAGRTEQLLLVAVARRTRDTEIGQLRAAAWIDDDVGRFHVAMDHVRRVRRVERRRYLRDESRDLVWRERAALREHVAKGLARDELHDHERVRAFAAFVEDRDDLRVHDRRGAASLVGEPRAERLIGAGAEKLDRDVASELLVAPTPDLAPAAF